MEMDWNTSLKSGMVDYHMEAPQEIPLGTNLDQIVRWIRPNEFWIMKSQLMWTALSQSVNVICTLV